MKTKRNLTGLIRPLNMEPTAYRTMYASAPPENLTMVVYLLLHSVNGGCGDSWGQPPWFEKRPIRVLEALARECIKGSAFPDMECEVIVGCLDDYPAYITEVISLHPLQDQWVNHCMYAQVGFYSSDGDYRGLVQPQIALHTAMTVCDAMYARTGSVDPKHHHPLAAAEERARDYRLIVNGIYEERLGIWCEALRQLRNEVLVKMHATVINKEDDDPRKPDEEWKKFCAAGLVYFLDYLKILHA